MLNKALRKRSTEKARKIVLKKTLRKVILLNEVLKIVFLLKKAFPKKMILKCTNIFKKVLKKAIQKVVKEKSFQKSAEKKYSEKLIGSRLGSKKLFLSNKTLNKVFLSKRSSQKAFQVGDIHWKYIFLLLNEKSSAPRQVEHFSHSWLSIAGDLRP